MSVGSAKKVRRDRMRRSQSEMEEIENNVEEKLVTNFCSLYFYQFCLGIGVLQTAWVLTGNVHTIEPFIEMFDWDETDARIYNTLITTSGVLGMAIGTLLSSRSINKGRRKATLIWAWPAIIGSFVAQVPLVPSICVGRLLCGLTAGHANTIMMKATLETVPSKYLGYFKWMSNFYIALGILFSYSLGDLDLPILPYIGEINWRVIYLMPAVFSLLQIIMFGCVYKYEPIAFCIKNGRIDEARLFLKQIY